MKTIQFTIILIIVSAFLVEGETYYKISEFVDLISDIKELHKATTVILVHSIRYENVLEMEFMFHLSRMLLRRNFTIVIESSHMNKFLENYYKMRNGHPLLVAFLTSQKSIQVFEAHSKNMHLISPFWFIIFWKMHEMQSYDYCKHPYENPFKSAFDSQLLIKCYDDENIYEWYSIYKNKTEVRHFASWDSKSRLNLTIRKELYMQRNQTGGESLKISVMKDITQFKGISTLIFQLVKELALNLNFTLEEKITKVTVENRSYIRHEWSRTMNQSYKGEVNILVTPMIMTSKRLKDVDFFQPLLLTSNYLYIKQPETLMVLWFAHFQTFNSKVWYSIVAFMLITPIFLSFIKLIINESNVTFFLILFDSYFNVWRIYCQQGLTEHVLCSSLKLAYFSIFISSWIIISLFSAYLISYITLPAPSLPFNDIEGFLADGTYKLLVIKQSEEYDSFQFTNDPILKKIKLLMKEETHLPVTLENGFEQVCKERVALYNNEIKKKLLRDVPCSLVKVKTGRINSVSLTITKRNPFTKVIKVYLQRFLENGILNRLKKTYYSVVKDLPQTQNVEVELQGVAPILVIMSGGFGLALLILLFEKIYFFCTNNREDTKLPYVN